jgi:hypothetical protein
MVTQPIVLEMIRRVMCEPKKIIVYDSQIRET